MRSLFLKIFLSFWLAQALFVILAILVTLALRPEPESAKGEYLRAAAAGQVVSAYERDGAEAARKSIESLQSSSHIRAYIFDDQYNEISGRPAPGWARHFVRSGPPPRHGLFDFMVPERFINQSIAGPSGRVYTLVAELPETHALFGRHPIPGLGIGIAVLSSGLACYFLAWYLTYPVSRLRAATKRLALGDLTARAGGPRNRRRDEIGELVRDFDSMAERLEKAVDAQSRLLKDISHELRSPLARLSVALGLLRQRSSPEAEQSLDRIELEASRLNEMIGRLLTLSQLEASEETIRRSPTRLAELVREIVKDADFEAQDRDRHVHYDESSDPLVIANPSLLRSAIENVVRNATRYTREGTSVEISVEQVAGPNGTEAVVRVSDSGPGVPEEALGKLFQPFYRIDDARVRGTGGVGLGLAITDRAMHVHGGSVQAFNRPEGGLMVELRLPVAPTSIAASPPGHATSESR